MSIHIYLKYKYIKENAVFSYTLYRWFQNIKNFQQTIKIFHGFSPRNVRGANPQPPNVHMTFLVDKIDMCRFPYTRARE